MNSSNSVVFAGQFNPAIFSPAWIRQYCSIDFDDGEDAKIGLIHEDLADFALAEVRFYVDRAYLRVISSVHELGQVAKIAVELVRDVLPHTPIFAAGINLDRPVDLGSFDARNRLGRTLAPIDAWGSWASKFENSDPVLNGGLTNITMRNTFSADPLNFEDVSIRPIVNDANIPSAVMFSINHHFGVVDIERKLPADAKERAQITAHVESHFAGVEQVLDEVVAQLTKIAKG